MVVEVRIGVEVMGVMRMGVALGSGLGWGWGSRLG